MAFESPSKTGGRNKKQNKLGENNGKLSQSAGINLGDNLKKYNMTLDPSNLS